MKSIFESILNSTGSGKMSIIAKEIELVLPGTKYVKDFNFETRDGEDAVYILQVPNNTTLKISEWPPIRLIYFEPWNKYDIIINGQDEYQKFLKYFKCNIGDYSYTHKLKLDELPVIHFNNCTVKCSELVFKYYCKLKFNRCTIDFSSIPNAIAIEANKSCKIDNKYFQFDMLKYLDLYKCK